MHIRLRLVAMLLLGFCKEEEKQNWNYDSFHLTTWFVGDKTNKTKSLTCQRSSVQPIFYFSHVLLKLSPVPSQHLLSAVIYLAFTLLLQLNSIMRLYPNSKPGQEPPATLQLDQSTHNLITSKTLYIYNKSSFLPPLRSLGTLSTSCVDRYVCSQTITLDI